MAKVVNVQEAKIFPTPLSNKVSPNDTKSSSYDASKAFDEILKYVGDKNCYQWKLLLLCGVLCMFSAFHNIAAVYLAATPEYVCDIPYLREKNLTNDQAYINISVPWVKNQKNVLTPSTCQYYDFDFSEIEDPSSIEGNKSFYKSLKLIGCNAWVYDRSVYLSTVVSEWDLVCDKKWIRSTTQASYMLGILMGAVICSALSDKFGRRSVSLTCSVFFITSSIAAAFSNVLITFLILRFIVAFTSHGMFLCNYVLCMEFVGEKGRSYMGSFYQNLFGLGFITLNLFAYLLRNWRHLQLSLSVPTVLLIGYFWLLPESPRWLLMQGRENEAIKILEKVAKVNHKEFPPEEKLRQYLDIISQEVKSRPILSTKQKIKTAFTIMVDLVKTKNMRRRSLILYYSWFVVSMLYYGITFAGATINASIYLSVTVSSLAEIIAMIAELLFVPRVGRRSFTCFCFLLGGICVISVAYVPSALLGLNLTLGLIGVACMSVDFVLVYILSAELVPTSVRNISVGTSSMFARIGSAIAPYIVDLLGVLYYATPFIIFGILAIIAGLLCLLLPETRNKKLPESIQEIELMSR
ncbi:UNVERIFIED_CONTAM: hypothetical protein RMT77_011942 [Armadillidium vulgare]